MSVNDTKNVAIVCRHRDSNLITIWRRYETVDAACTDLQLVRADRGGEYVFAVVEL